jgi:hypothetical protein
MIGGTGMAQALGWMWLVAGVSLALIGWAAGAGRLSRRGLVRLRTRSSMRSSVTWDAAQRAGGHWFVGGGALVAMTGALMLMFTPDDDTAAVMSIVLMPALMICLITGAVLGIQAARKAAADVNR